MLPTHINSYKADLRISHNNSNQIVVVSSRAGHAVVQYVRNTFIFVDSRFDWDA